MKKLSFIFIWGMLFTYFFSSTVFAYSDVPPTYQNYHVIEAITDAGIVKGYPDGTFKPDQVLNRAELLKIIVESVYRNNPIVASYDRKSCFDDVPAGQWYTKYVCFAKDKGIVVGYTDGNFRPDQQVYFVEALKMAMETYNSNFEMYDIASASPSGAWYKPYIDSASENNIIPLDIVMYYQPLKRGQMADLIVRILYPHYNYNADFPHTYIEKDLPGAGLFRVTYDSINDGVLVRNFAEHYDWVDGYFTGANFYSYVSSEMSYEAPKFLITSKNSETQTDISCMQGYESGDFDLILISGLGDFIDHEHFEDITLNGHPLNHFVCLEESCDEEILPPYVAIREYGDCNNDIYSLYFIDENCEEGYPLCLKPMNFDNLEDNKISISNGFVITDTAINASVNGNKLTYYYYNNAAGEYYVRKYEWDSNLEIFEFMYESVYEPSI